MLGIALLAALAVPKRAPALEGVPDSSGPAYEIGLHRPGCLVT